MDNNIVNLGKQGIAADMTVVEFLVGMALTRGGAMSPRDLAHAVSAWLGKPVRSAALGPALAALKARGWVHCAAGTYTIGEEGIEALRGFYSAIVRMLDGGRRLLDVAVFLSLIKEFERNGS